MSPLDWIAAVLLVSGCCLGALGGLGVVRLPDVYGRMHAATKPPTLGLVLVALGAMLRVDSAADVAFLVLVVMLQFLTAPVGAHLIGRAAHDSGGLEAPATVRDDLAEHDATEPDESEPEES
ncbi:MAG: monovalent cation/H(+) antiporter subunit G [Actinomycetota bacterium]|nr:monovalent cation/H(+) antiporter subunit G [Actinomycetota bacterium]